jgi:uncharacterized protein HemX
LIFVPASLPAICRDIVRKAPAAFLLLRIRASAFLATELKPPAPGVRVADGLASHWNQKFMRRYLSLVAALAILAAAFCWLSLPPANAQSAAREPVATPAQQQEAREAAVEQQQRIERYNQLIREQEDKAKRVESLLERQEKLMDKQEAAFARFEKILDTWELQQKEYQKYLDSLKK